MVSAPMHLFSTNRIANKLPSSAVVVQPLPSMLVKSTTPIANVSLGPLYSYRADRKQMLETGCSQPNIPSVYALPNLIRDSEMLNHLGFILQSHSLFYCSVPKVATRTFLMFLTYLHLRDELMAPVKPNSRSPSFKADHLYQVLPPSSKNDSILPGLLSHLLTHLKPNSSQLDLWPIYQKDALPLVRLRTLSTPSLLFSSSFKRAIFVRHPLERLVSAYTDKITSLQPEPFSLYDTIRRAICRRFSSFYLTKDEQKVYQRHRGLERQLNEPCAKKIPSLDHFVEYLSADSVQADVHWHPYSTLCHVCTLKYNFIGKYETLEDDFRSFLSGVGLNSSEWNRNNPYSTGRSKDHYRSMYSQLSDRSICFLKYFYREDLKNFNYQFEDYFPDRRKIDCSSAHFRSFRKPV